MSLWELQEHRKPTSNPWPGDLCTNNLLSQSSSKFRSPSHDSRIHTLEAGAGQPAKWCCTDDKSTYKHVKLAQLSHVKVAQLFPNNCRRAFVDAAQDFSEDKLKVTVWNCSAKALQFLLTLQTNFIKPQADDSLSAITGVGNITGHREEGRVSTVIRKFLCCELNCLTSCLQLVFNGTCWCPQGPKDA